MGRRSGGEHRYGAGAGTRARATLGTSVQPSWVRSASTTIQGWGIRNPKVETRNKFKFPISQCSKPAAAAWFWSFPCWCLGFVSGFGFRFSDLSPQRSVVLSRFARVERRASALSRVYSVGAWGKEPQRREERREKWEGEAATANHLSVIDSQVTEIGLVLHCYRADCSQAAMKISCCQTHEFVRVGLDMVAQVAASHGPPRTRSAHRNLCNH